MYAVVSADPVDVTPRIYSKEEMDRLVDTKVPISAGQIINEALRTLNEMIVNWNTEPVYLSMDDFRSRYVEPSVRIWDPKNLSAAEYRAWRERGGGTE